MSFWTIGFCCIFWEGMLFEKTGNYLDEKLPEYLSKPLYGCYICACFWYGSAIYWLFLGSDWKEYFLTVFASMGLNAAISKLYKPEVTLVEPEK